MQKVWLTDGISSNPSFLVTSGLALVLSGTTVHVVVQKRRMLHELRG